jgi:hypothetical protein
MSASPTFILVTAEVRRLSTFRISDQNQQKNLLASRPGLVYLSLKLFQSLTVKL